MSFSLPTLDSLVPQSWSYPVRGAVLRLIRGLIGQVVSAVVIIVSDNTILQGLHVPVETQALVSVFTGQMLVALDKYLREKGYEEAATDSPEPPAEIAPEVPAPPVASDAPAVDEPLTTPPDL